MLNAKTMLSTSCLGRVTFSTPVILYFLPLHGELDFLLYAASLDTNQHNHCNSFSHKYTLTHIAFDRHCFFFPPVCDNGDFGCHQPNTGETSINMILLLLQCHCKCVLLTRHTAHSALYMYICSCDVKACMQCSIAQPRGQYHVLNHTRG